MRLLRYATRARKVQVHVVREMAGGRRIAPRLSAPTQLEEAIRVEWQWRVTSLLFDAVLERMSYPPPLHRRHYRIAGATGAIRTMQLRTRGVECTAAEYDVFAAHCVTYFGAVSTEGVPSGARSRHTLSVIDFPSMHSLCAALGISTARAQGFACRTHTVSRTGERYALAIGATYKSGPEGAGRCVLLQGNVPIAPLAAYGAMTTTRCLHTDDLRWNDGDWASPFTTHSSASTCMCEHWRADVAPIADYNNGCRFEWHARKASGGYKPRTVVGPIRAVFPAVRIRGESAVEALAQGEQGMSMSGSVM